MVKLVHGFLFLALCALCKSQFFDSKMDDRSYLDNVEQEVEDELVAAKAELMEQAKVMENATRAYIAVKLKENVFRALRQIAEHELGKVKSNPKLHVRQDYFSEDYIVRQEEEDDDDDTTQKTTTPLTGLGTAVKVNQQVFSFLGEAFNIIFGGNKPKPKKYIDPAAVLLDTPSDVQLLGLVSLLAREEENMPLPEVSPKTEPVTDNKKPIPAPYPGLVIEKKNKKSGAKKGEEDNSLELDIDSLNEDARIFDIFTLLGLRKRFQAAAKKNESLSGFDEPSKKTNAFGLTGLTGLGQGGEGQRFNFEKFVKNFKKSMSELQANTPDIYRGVREAYKLLDSIRGVATRLEEYVDEIF